MTTISYPIAGSDQKYWVYEVDAHGYEIPEMQSGKKQFVSRTLVSLVSDPAKPVSDVVVVIHGWNTHQVDNEEIDFYDMFFDAFMKDYRDFPPQSPDQNLLLIGVHWPSAPGAGRANERIDDESTFEENVRRMETIAKSLRTTDPPAATRIEKILTSVSAAAAADGAPGLSKAKLQAKLDKVEHSLAVPEEDVDESDDDIADVSAETDAQVISTYSEGGLFSFTKFILSNVLRVLEDKIFGQFVRRSEEIGENGVHTLLALLQEYAPPTTQFHLIAHSLGAGALCRSLVGRDGGKYLLRKKITSASLLQGALGSRSLGAKQPFERITRGLCPVAGPIVVTTSQSDKALLPYRFFHDLPIGLHGAVDVEPMPSSLRELQDTRTLYDFKPGELFNIIADKFIDQGDFVAGSHSDVFGPEVMRMVRQAMETQVTIAKHVLPTKLSREYFRERFQASVGIVGEPEHPEGSTGGGNGGEEKPLGPGGEGEEPRNDQSWSCVLS